jgi:integrase
MKNNQKNRCQATGVDHSPTRSDRNQNLGKPKIILQSDSLRDNPNCSKKSGKESNICMKGSIFFQKDRGRWAVSWYCQLTNRNYTITRYKGEFMYHFKIAEKCLAMIQSRWEEHQNGLCQFRIEEFTGKGWTDVIEYYRQWMQEVVQPNLKPNTIKAYSSYLKNWIAPFFEANPVMMHEIQLDTLTKLKNSIDLTGKGKLNVIMALHSMLDYAYRSKRIPAVPPFPKKHEYGIVEPLIKWVPEDRQMRIINAIPEIDRPIFLWLKYHLRRPGEACVLKWEDYDAINQVFIVRRALSARRVVESTKTRVEHIMPVHPQFLSVLRGMQKNLGGYIFRNPRARKAGRRYTHESLNIIWKKACIAVEESIDLYSGLKHSSCSQYVNEKGLSIYDLQEITGHANLESVRKYAAVSVARKRELLERKKVIQLQDNFKLQKDG